MSSFEDLEKVDTICVSSWGRKSEEDFDAGDYTLDKNARKKKSKLVSISIPKMMMFS